MELTNDKVDPNGWPPRQISAELARVGGKNIYGLPNYRLVLAQSVLKLRNGNWKTSLGHVLEARWVPRYPNLKGWVLEEWHPAHKFGTPEQWARDRVPGFPELPVLAAYPSEGGYMLAYHVPQQKIPPLSYLCRAVNYAEYCREFWAQFTPEQRRKLWEQTDAHQDLLAKTFERGQKIAMIHEELSPLFGSSLEAGRVRNALAERAGITSHCGN